MDDNTKKAVDMLTSAAAELTAAAGHLQDENPDALAVKLCVDAAEIKIDQLRGLLPATEW